MRPTLSAHRVPAVTAAGMCAPRSPWGNGAWWDNAEVKAKLVAFGEIQISGERYTCDVVIEGGRIRRRLKGPSKALRDRFGHTPLSAAEDIPGAGNGSSLERVLRVRCRSRRMSTRKVRAVGSRLRRSRPTMPVASSLG